MPEPMGKVSHSNQGITEIVGSVLGQAVGRNTQRNGCDGHERGKADRCLFSASFVSHSTQLLPLAFAFYQCPWEILVPLRQKGT